MFGFIKFGFPNIITSAVQSTRLAADDGRGGRARLHFPHGDASSHPRDGYRQLVVSRLVREILRRRGTQPDLFGTDDRDEALRDAVRLAVDDQLRAGADLITDGEMQRVDFNLGFYDYLTGLEPLPPGRRWGPPAHDQRSRYLCVEPLAAPHGLGVVAEYRRLHALTNAPVKMPVPGPFTLAGCIQGGEVYRDRRAVTEALMPLVNHEMQELEQAGVEFIQLDEPSFACQPDQPEEFLDIIARTVDGVGAKISMHMCFGNYRGRAVGRRSYRPLFPHMARAAVQQLALEFASREMAEIELAARDQAADGAWRSVWWMSRTPGSSRRSSSRSGCGWCCNTSSRSAST